MPASHPELGSAPISPRLALASALWSRLGAVFRSELKPTNGSWSIDETSIRVKAICRAVDSGGATIDFLLPKGDVGVEGLRTHDSSQHWAGCGESCRGAALACGA